MHRSLAAFAAAVSLVAGGAPVAASPAAGPHAAQNLLVLYHTTAVDGATCRCPARSRSPAGRRRKAAGP